MMALFYIGGLAISAIFVSILAATFSVSGLAKLFSGSAVAVLLMGASLELAKFITAAFLHRVWAKLHWLYKTYMLTAVVVLSLITSMGIFGFLSDAYQSSSSDLISYNIQLDSLKAERQRMTDEVARLNKQIEEIPATRITKRAELRSLNEPQIKELLAKDNEAATKVRDMELKIVEIKNKVGPLIYIARAFDRDLDTVVKWLILVFVSVFDPLAICLVIATGEALRMRPLGYLDGMSLFETPVVSKPSEPVASLKTEPVASLKTEPVASTNPEPVASAAAGPVVNPVTEAPNIIPFANPPLPAAETQSVAQQISQPEPAATPLPEEVEVLEMRVPEILVPEKLVPQKLVTDKPEKAS